MVSLTRSILRHGRLVALAWVVLTAVMAGGITLSNTSAGGNECLEWHDGLPRKA